MKKRIIAGVAALLMVASICPANSSNFIAPAVITASAAAETYEINGTTVEISVNGEEILVQVGDLQKLMKVPAATTDLHVNISNIELSPDDNRTIGDLILDAAGGDLTDKKVTLKKPNADSYGIGKAVTSLTFEDPMINSIGPTFASGLNESMQEVNFGEYIRYIGISAFSGDSILQGSNGTTTLDLSNIIEVGDNAFNGCSHFENITFGEGLTKIGVSAFASDSGLKSLVFPTTLEYIGQSAFGSCQTIKSIDFGGNDSLKEIGIAAFNSCTALHTVHVNGEDYNTLPPTTSVMGTNVFMNCTSLQNFKWQDEFVIIPKYTFSGCTSLNNFVFGTGVENSQCDRIDDFAFQSCSGLTEMILPDANTFLGMGSFQGCKNLKVVEVSDDLAIIGGDFDESEDVDRFGKQTKTGNGSTFANCEKLSLWPRSTPQSKRKYDTVILPDNCRAIQRGTFAGCIGIREADISPAAYLGQDAFSKCVSLEKIEIPDAVKIIEKNAFNECTKLEDVVVSPELEDIDQFAFFKCEKLSRLVPSTYKDRTDLAGTILFPRTLAGVRQGSFKGCSGFQYLNFEDGSQFAIVGPNSFEDCTKLKGANKNANGNDTINMPSGVQEIQNSAFKGCTALEKLYFLGDITTISDMAFENCENLTEVRMKDTITQMRAAAFRGCKSLKHMPRTLDGQGYAFTHIDKLWDSTFQNCESLEDAYIPANVTEINPNAFNTCTKLTKVQWEKGSKLRTIGDNAFNACESLALFSSSKNDTVSTFPDSVTKISDNCFAGTAITSVKFAKPAGGNKLFLGKNMFQNNKALKKVDLSETYTDSIPDSFCANCENLETVVLPDANISEVGINAFSECHYLHTFGRKTDKTGEITFPEYMTSVKPSSFQNNFCMEVVNFPASTTQIYLSMFNIYWKLEDIEEKGYTPNRQINVDKDNPKYKSIDGVLYTKSGDELLRYPIAKRDESFELPSSVKTMGDYSMAANPFIKYVYLQKDRTKTSALDTIKDNTFHDDHNLEFVDFGTIDNVAMGKQLFNRTPEKTTLYGVSGSTVEKYATEPGNAGYVTFVDNDKVAKTLTITKSANDGGKTISNSIKIAKGVGTYTFGCKQKDASGAESLDTLIWESSNPEVAVINNNGVLSIKEMGKTTITVRNAADTAKKSIEVEINEKGEPKSTDSNNSSDSSSKKSDNDSSKKSNNDSSKPDGNDSKILGDVDGNGDINVTDIAKLAAHIKGMKPLSDDAQTRADVTKDGNLNVSDISTLAAHIKGIKPIKD